MRLRKSLKAVGTDDLEEILQEELYDHTDDLPIEDVMENGGWPESSSFDITVSDISDDAEFVYANVAVYFDEEHASTCADITFTSSYFVKLNLRLDKESGEADFDCEESANVTDDGEDDDPEKRADRDYLNSEF
jgi:hypothetical protein